MISNANANLLVFSTDDDIFGDDDVPNSAVDLLNKDKVNVLKIYRFLLRLLQVCL